MTQFIQLHVLTNYGASNLNRDDIGRPKTVLMGDCVRLRISSQSLKRAWRTSDVFESSLAGHLGTRTKRAGDEWVYRPLLAAGISDKDAREWARAVAGQFGALEAAKEPKKGSADNENTKDLEIKQLAHFSPEEKAAIDGLVKVLGTRKSAPTADELKLLSVPRKAADIAMFGRMLADHPAANMEAAVQVAHAVTVHKAAVEDDYFSAVDDLSKEDSSGAGHIGERGYGAGVFYLYLCIDANLLVANLGGDKALASKVIQSLVRAVTQVSPTGMQASYASRAYASYVLAESGQAQPRSLVQAFLSPIRPAPSEGLLPQAIQALEATRDGFNQVYGPDTGGQSCVLNVPAVTGSLEKLFSFVHAAVESAS